MKLFNDFEYPILAGIAGFILAVSLFTCNGCPSKKTTTFRELRLGGEREAVIDLLQTKICYLDTAIDQLVKDSSTNCIDDTKAKSAYCTQLIARNKKFREEREAMKKSLYDLHYNNADTSALFFAGYFSMSAKELKPVLERFERDTVLTAVATDSSFLEKGHGRPIQVAIKSSPKEESLVEFVRRNPALGFWLLLSIGQMTLWFLLAILLSAWLYSLRPANFKWGDFLTAFITPVIAVLLFIALFYYRLIDEYLFTDSAILQGFGWKMFVYATPGYIAAAICFGIYIYSAGQLKEIDKTLKATPNDPATLQTFKKMEDLFNGAFLTTAVILSLFILWLGILFNGINGMEIMQYYEHISGKPFLNGDFVYMVALSHTILLLLFYIPVKLKLNSLQATQRTDPATATPKKWFTFMAEGLGTILVTASPLITSLLEKAISGLFN